MNADFVLKGEKDSSIPFEVPWIMIIIVTGVLLFFVIQLDHLIVKNFEEPVESDVMVEFVDRNVLVEIQVPVFGCPTDHNRFVSSSCVQFGKSIQPLSDESVNEILNGLGVCNEDRTVCEPCLRIEQVGWTCIDNQYLSEVEQ